MNQSEFTAPLIAPIRALSSNEIIFSVLLSDPVRQSKLKLIMYHVL